MRALAADYVDTIHVVPLLALTSLAGLRSSFSLAATQVGGRLRAAMCDPDCNETIHLWFLYPLRSGRFSSSSRVQCISSRGVGVMLMTGCKRLMSSTHR